MTMKRDRQSNEIAFPNSITFRSTLKVNVENRNDDGLNSANPAISGFEDVSCLHISANINNPYFFDEIIVFEESVVSYINIGKS